MRGDGGCQTKKKKIKQIVKLPISDSCDDMNTGGGAWILGKCEGATEKSDEFICEWEVES